MHVCSSIHYVMSMYSIVQYTLDLNFALCFCSTSRCLSILACIATHIHTQCACTHINIYRRGVRVVLSVAASDLFASFAPVQRL